MLRRRHNRADYFPCNDALLGNGRLHGVGSDQRPYRHFQYGMRLDGGRRHSCDNSRLGRRIDGDFVRRVPQPITQGNSQRGHGRSGGVGGPHREHAGGAQGHRRRRRRGDGKRNARMQARRGNGDRAGSQNRAGRLHPGQCGPAVFAFRQVGIDPPHIGGRRHAVGVHRQQRLDAVAKILGRRSEGPKRPVHNKWASFPCTESVSL